MKRSVVNRRESQALVGSATGDHDRAFRRFNAVLTLAVLTALICLSAMSEAPSPARIVVLAGLMIAAEHRDQLFGDETSMSGSIAVGICAVVTFSSQAPLLGPFVCGLTASLYWPHIRHHAWAKVIANAGSIGFSALAAALVFSELRTTTAGMETAVAVVAAVLAYWLVNSATLAAAMVVARGGSFFGECLRLIKSEAVMLVFALGGGLCGLLFVEVGTWAGASALALELVVVDLLVISRPRSRARVRAPGVEAAIGWGILLAVAAAGAFASANALGPVGAVLAATLGASVFRFAMSVLLLRRSLGQWEGRLAMGVVFADAPFAALAASVGAAAALGGLVAGMVAAIGAGCLAAMGAWWRRRSHHVEAIGEDDDVVALALLELALADRAGRTAPE